MENPRMHRSEGSADRATGAHSSRAGGSSGARRTGSSAQTPRGARSASGRAAGSARTAQSRGSSARRPAAQGKRTPPRKRRRRGLPANRLWLLCGAGVLAAAAIVVITVVLTSGGPKTSVAPEATQEVAAIQTAEPTAAPLPTNVPTYTVRDDYPRTNDPLGLPESARVDDSYFDDALFVGDSVTLALRQYVLNTRKSEQPNLLGKAQFLAAQSFGTRNALREVTETSIHPTIGGVKMTLEEAISLSGAKKLFIMLGMNDVGVSGVDKAVEYMIELLDRIEEKNPDITIFVESATPRLSGTHPSTNQLFVYDVWLYDALLERADPNIYFVDVAYVMRDEQGKLFEEFCSDPDNMALHFNNAGCRKWIDYLYTHALV